MPNYLIHDIQLTDLEQEAIISAGGTVLVCDNGLLAKATLLDPDNDYASLANPFTPTRGKIRFAVADTIDSVDIYGLAPGGQAIYKTNVKAGAVPRIRVDLAEHRHTLFIPFDHADFAAATEVDTGFDEPSPALINNVAVFVEDIDATETIDVGTLSTNSGDADGYLDGVSVATAGLVKGTLNSGGQTLGALLHVDESGAGVLVPEPHVSTGNSITATLSAGSDTASGVIAIDYTLVPNPTVAS